MDMFQFTGSSCLMLANGSTVKDWTVLVKGMSSALTGSEESTGRLCDAFAAFSATPVLPSWQVYKPSYPSGSSPFAPGSQLSLLVLDPLDVSL